jgi:hypothetical protein
MRIDICTTATIRPEILERTYSSFKTNLFSNPVYDIQVNINVDPIGTGGSAMDVIDVAKKYFNTIKYNTPKVPSFSKAFNWVLNAVRKNTNVVFLLEDDWILNRPIPIANLMLILFSDKELQILRLGAFKSCATHMKNWNKIFQFNGQYYVPPEREKGNLAFCGHPSFIKPEFIFFVRKYLDPSKNSEKQIKGRNPLYRDFLLKYKYGVYGIPDAGPIVSDIGRQWMVENNLKKKGSKAFFDVWENSGNI